MPADPLIKDSPDNGKNEAELRDIARRVRVAIVRMLHKAGSGHPGGSLSAVEIMVSLFYERMRHDSSNPAWPERDRFILSKGHAAPVLYAVLAMQGYFPEDDLWSLRKFGSHLQGHPDSKTTPGVEVSTGSLGQGLSMGNGMALALRLDGLPGRVYVLLGDGEMQEGMVWEAAMTAAHRKLDNLCAVVDCNNLQIDGFVDKVKGIEPLDQKFTAFGWKAIEVDGHDLPALREAFDKAEERKGKPTVIIARTVKGKGVSFMENKARYHGVAPTDGELKTSLKELGAWDAGASNED